MKKTDIIKILEEKQINFDEFEVYLKNELGLEANSNVKWIRIEQDEINNLIEKFQEQLVGQSPRTRSSSDKSSETVASSNATVESETHKISPDTPNKVTLLKQQTISFELLPGKDSKTGEHLADEFRCVLNFGKERPPTIVAKSQGRHVSSYVLFIETIKSRLEGMDIEEAINTVEEIVLEYVDESAKCIEQFQEYVEARKLALKLSGVISKEDRKEIYQIEETKIPDGIKELERNLKLSLQHCEQNPDAKKHIEEALKNLSSIVELRNQKDEILPSLEIRNKVKRADLWKYQQCLVDTIKAGMVVLNRMEGVAFTGIKKKTAAELGSEGRAASDAMASLREIDPNQIDAADIVSQMMKLFDYPFKDIKAKAEEDKKSDQDVVEEFYQALRRHEKLCYDSFSGFRGLDENDIKQIRQQFLEDILDQENEEWSNFLDNHDKSNKTIKLKLDKYSGGIEIKSGSFKLQKRFEAKPYSSFTEAITKLESEVEKLQEKIESKDGGGRYVQ